MSGCDQYAVLSRLPMPELRRLETRAQRAWVAASANEDIAANWLEEIRKEILRRRDRVAALETPDSFTDDLITQINEME